MADKTNEYEVLVGRMSVDLREKPTDPFNYATHDRGATVELTDAQAKRYLEVGAIRPVDGDPAAALQATPYEPGSSGGAGLSPQAAAAEGLLRRRAALTPGPGIVTATSDASEDNQPEPPDPVDPDTAPEGDRSPEALADDPDAMAEFGTTSTTEGSAVPDQQQVPIGPAAPDAATDIEDGDSPKPRKSTRNR